MNTKPTPTVCYLQPSPQPLEAGPAKATWLPWPVLTEAMAEVRSARKVARSEPGARGLKRGFLYIAVGREVSLRLARLGLQNICLLHKTFEMPDMGPETTQVDVEQAYATTQRLALEFAHESKMPLPWLDVDIMIMLDEEWFGAVKDEPTVQSEAVQAFLSVLIKQGVTIKSSMLDTKMWAGLELSYSNNLAEFKDPANAEHWATVAAEQELAFKEANRVQGEAPQGYSSFAETIMRKQF